MLLEINSEVQVIIDLFYLSFLALGRGNAIVQDWKFCEHSLTNKQYIHYKTLYQKNDVYLIFLE